MVGNFVPSSFSSQLSLFRTDSEDPPCRTRHPSQKVRPLRSLVAALAPQRRPSSAQSFGSGWKWLVALHCESASTMRTFMLYGGPARADATMMVVDDLYTPPFKNQGAIRVQRDPRPKSLAATTCSGGMLRTFRFLYAFEAAQQRGSPHHVVLPSPDPWARGGLDMVGRGDAALLQQSQTPPEVDHVSPNLPPVSPPHRELLLCSLRAV